MIRLGILGSGSGSNMQSIMDAIDAGEIDAEIAVVMSDNPEAFILERAKKANLSTKEIDCLGFKNKFPEESQVKTAEVLKEYKVDLVCLAGFMRIVKQPLLESFPNKIVNIHPSLLPLYPGLHAWEQAIEDGATFSGCTVHYVDGGMDTGELICQESVPVLPGDTAESLHKRIQEVEHRLYPEVIQKFAEKQR